MLQVPFNSLSDRICPLVNSKVAALLETKEFSDQEVPEWTTTLSQEVTDSLKELDPDFKYCVNCVIIQKGERGLFLSSANFSDPNTDGNLTIKWENKTLVCVMIIFGIAFS